MASADAGEPAPGRWLSVVIWLIVSGGVFWCVWTSWQEGVPWDRIVEPRREPGFILVMTPDPMVMHWLPAVAGFGALIAGLISGISGRGSMRFLVCAGTVSAMKAVTVGIERLVGQ